jgi:type VI protein secretion system component Hcp
LFFDQVFLRSLKAALSTFLFAMKMHGVAMDKPVDKSVTKLWKDSAEGRGYWLGAIVGFTHQP